MKYIILITIFFLNTLFAEDRLTFRLNSKSGIVTEKSFSEQYLLIAVGYTSCPDICPTTLIDMRGALSYLDKTPKIAAKIKPLFITIDPITDTLKGITQYTKYFDSRISGLRTENFKDLDNVVEKLRASYGYIKDGKPVIPPDLPKGYTVFHSTYIYLYDTDRKLVDVFPYNLKGSILGEKLFKILTI